MDIRNQQNYTPNFQAKIRLKELRALYNPSMKESTRLDKMFNENKLVKGCENISVYTKRNIINTYFDNPVNIFSKTARKLCENIVKYSRITADKIFFINNRRSINKLDKTFSRLQPESKEYIEELAKVGNSMDKHFIRTNLEDNPLKNVSKSKNATIFVLNHPNYHKDKFSYVIINSILNKMYTEQGRQLDCPRPRIIVSKNMLKMLGNKVGKIYKQLGLSEVDASLKHRDTKTNTHTMHSLMKEFIDNKSNIFIFPEGNNSAYNNMPLEQRIQPGIAGLIKTAVQTKDSVRVVPVGLHYTNEKNSFGNLYVGKPMYFKKSGNDIVYTQGTDKKKIAHVNLKESIPVIFNEICKNIKFGMEKASEL